MGNNHFLFEAKNGLFLMGQKFLFLVGQDFLGEKLENSNEFKK
jgi:hypothetical protein